MKYHQMLRKNTNIFIIIGGGEIDDELSIYRDKIYAQTAKVLGVSVHTVYRLISLGELSAIKVSPRKTVIKAEVLEKYINRK